MGFVKCGLCLLVLAVSQASAYHCLKNPRIPWIPEQGIHIADPWLHYPEPERYCCEQFEPPVEVDLQEKCSLCYELTKSTPGFAADPNNCQNFYMCEQAGGTDKWTVYPMKCPDCTFWDQVKLTCVEVFSDPDGTGVCGHYDVVTGEAAPMPTFEPEVTLFCINFENKYQLADHGVYVMNDGVTIVDSASCPEGNSCGLFNGGRLQIPYFANNYASMPSLRITFYYKSLGGSNEQGIISNDCYPDATKPYGAGNSLYCSIEGDNIRAGLKEPAADVSAKNASATSSWVYVELTWDGDEVWMILRDGGPSEKLIGFSNKAPFKSAIRNSHCPLVIGSFIKEAVGSYFNGYMDDICFHRF